MSPLVVSGACSCSWTWQYHCSTGPNCCSVNIRSISIFLHSLIFLSSFLCHFASFLIYPTSFLYSTSFFHIFSTSPTYLYSSCTQLHCHPLPSFNNRISAAAASLHLSPSPLVSPWLPVLP